MPRQDCLMDGTAPAERHEARLSIDAARCLFATSHLLVDFRPAHF